MEFEIDKAVLMITAVPLLTATYSDTLADVTLPDGFAWQEDDTTVLRESAAVCFLTF